MSNPKAANVSIMRSINRSSILELIRQCTPITRTRISHELGISMPTVMRIVEDLIADDLVRPIGHKESTGGRPPSLLEFNSKAYALIGLDLGGTKMFGTVADLSGNIQHELFLPHREGQDNYLENLCNLIEQLMDAPRLPGQQIRGIGVGAPGVTITPDGIVTWAPSLGWRDLPLQDLLSERFDVPVIVENDVNLTALGEWGFGVGQGAQNMVSIAVGTGIGAGIIIDGSLYRGHNQAAGEIGYILSCKDDLNQRYDAFGAFEKKASGPGIVARARQRLEEKKIPLPEDPLTTEAVFQAARNGEEWAIKVVDETVDYLTLAIANVSAIMNPELVILGGGVARSADLLVEPIRQRLVGIVPFPPRVAVSTLGRRAAVMGAIMIVLQGTMDYLVVKQVN
ncbi:MAG: ROK family transcriptional regulator [Anaerolineales bacterium]|nr:ROK family transcriptional regulator [Anaerolineales bacterium]